MLFCELTYIYFLNFLLNELIDSLEKGHNSITEYLQNLSMQKNSQKKIAAIWANKCFQVRFNFFVQTANKLPLPIILYFTAGNIN